VTGAVFPGAHVPFGFFSVGSVLVVFRSFAASALPGLFLRDEVLFSGVLTRFHKREAFRVSQAALGFGSE